MVRLFLLGTAGSHGIPVPFCNCIVCKTWKRRRRAGYLIEGKQKIWLEFSPEFREQIIECGKVPDYFYISHIHYDHVGGFPELKQILLMAKTIGKIKLILPQHIHEFLLSSKGFHRLFPESFPNIFWELYNKEKLEIYVVEPMKKFKLSEDTWMMLFNNIHGDIISSSLFYYENGKTFLYLADAEAIDDNIIDFNESIGVFDVVLAHTPFVFQKKGHLGMEDLREIRARKIILSHFSHSIGLKESELNRKIEEYSKKHKKEYVVGYDGMIINF